MDNKEFGYVRVSSKDQNEARQLDSMYALGIDKRDIHIDKQSGGKLSDSSRGLFPFANGKGEV